MSVALKEGQLFVKKKHELADLAKQLDKITVEAVDLIADTMMNANTPQKERLRCAETLIDLKIRITDQINKDELTRQIAAIKVKGVSTPLVGNEGTPKPTAPRLDMNNIQAV